MNQTKKDIKDFLISKDIKFSSIFEIDKLPGGSSNETWIIKYKNDSCVEKIVLRRHFQGIRNIDNEYPPVSLKIESDVMIAAYDEKIPVPKILYRTESKSNLGEGFFMEFIEGVALGNKIVPVNIDANKAKTSLEVGIRPQNLEVHPDANSELYIEFRERLGGVSYDYLKTPTGESLTVETKSDDEIKPGTKVSVGFKESDVLIFDRATGHRVR